MCKDVRCLMEQFSIQAGCKPKLVKMHQGGSITYGNACIASQSLSRVVRKSRILVVPTLTLACQMFKNEPNYVSANF